MPIVALMKHDIIELREYESCTEQMMIHLLSHFYTSSRTDEANGSIYITATVTYGVKGDPANERIPLRAFAICHRRKVDEPSSENGGWRADKFQVFIDRSPVMEKVQAVMAKA